MSPVSCAKRPVADNIATDTATIAQKRRILIVHSSSIPDRTSCGELAFVADPMRFTTSAVAASPVKIG
jgi:hypothetical protein